MSFLKHIRQLDKKFAWSFLGVVLAIIFGALAIYTAFYQERKPDLKFEILSNAAVLDVHERISNLDILFNGNNIKENKQALRVVIVRVINDGQLDILKNFYDVDDPLGFVVVNGSVVQKPELLHTSNDYLGRALKIDLRSPEHVLFSDVIIERGESFTLKILVLNKEEIVPDIRPIGKIAGIRNIPVIPLYKDTVNDSFLNRTFRGGVATQLVRVVAYPLALLFGLFALVMVIVGIAMPISAIKDHRDRARRKRLVTEFKASTGGAFDENDEPIFRLYTQRGADILASLNYLLDHRERLEKYIVSLGKDPLPAIGKSLVRIERDFLENRSRFESDDEHRRRLYVMERRLTLAKLLLSDGVIRRTETGLDVNESSVRTLKQLLIFLGHRKRFDQRHTLMDDLFEDDAATETEPNLPKDVDRID